MWVACVAALLRGPHVLAANRHAHEHAQAQDPSWTPREACIADCGGTGECAEQCEALADEICGQKCSALCPKGDAACAENCLSMQDRFCVARLPEAKVEVVSRPPTLVYADPAADQGDDFPVPVTADTPVWAEAKEQASEAVAVINQGRDANATKLDHVDLVSAWSHGAAPTFAKLAGFKLCLRVHVAGEETYLRVDTAPMQHEVLGSERMLRLIHVDPQVDSFGFRYVAAGRLAAYIGPDVDALFPCHRFAGVADPTSQPIQYAHHVLLNRRSFLEQPVAVETPDDEVVVAEPVGPVQPAGQLPASQPVQPVNPSGGPTAKAADVEQPRKDLPHAYDARSAFPWCAGPVRAQGVCGASYAFAAATLAAERLCIAGSSHASEEDPSSGALRADLQKEEQKLQDSADKVARLRRDLAKLSMLRRSAVPEPKATKDRKELVELSAQELVSCGSTTRRAMKTPFCLNGPGMTPVDSYSFGCEGGHAVSALAYVHEYGLPRAECAPFVSGGQLDNLPRLAPICETLEAKPCHGERELFKVGPPRALRGEARIQEAILARGPVLAQLDVRVELGAAYPDAFDQGIYVANTTSPKLGRQAVVLHGWGESAGIKYWVGRSSWGADWGLGGFFRIRRGVDEAGVESGAYEAVAGPGMKGEFKTVRSSDCIEIRPRRGSCELVNWCSTVRRVEVSFLGSQERCGSWRASVPELLPGLENAERVDDAHLCVIEQDAYVRDFDSGLLYEDVTAQYSGPGVLPLCLLRAPAEPRKRCCGDACASASGVASFPTRFCAAGCAELGFEVFELPA